MKKMKAIVFATFAATAAVTFAGCSGSAPENTETNEAVESTGAAESDASSETTEEQTEVSTYDISGVDFSKSEVEVNTYEGMKTLMNDITNGKYTDKVVTIEGVYSYFSVPNIMVRDGNGSGVGYEFQVEGFSDSDYPAEDTKIKITGVVKETGVELLGMKGCKIIVPKDNFQIL